MRAIDDELLKLADEAGLDANLKEYLQARKTITVGMVASIAKDYEEIDRILVQPLLDGYDDGMKTHKVRQEDAAVTKAAMRYLWRLCETRVANKGSSPGPVTPTTTATPNAPSSSKSTPKELPPDVLRQLIADYENETVGGRNRIFPQQMLLGAEKIVARCYYEIAQKSYTPLHLHEILCARYFDAAGNTNLLAQQSDSKSSNKVLIDVQANQLSVAEETSWTPKGVLSMLDAIDAIECCWTLCKIGHELDIVAYCAWWRTLVRSKPQRLEQVKCFWVEMSWKIALQMRQGKDFAQLTAEVMKDQYSLQTALSRETPAAPKKMPQAPSKPGNKPPYQTPNRGDTPRNQDRQNPGGQKRWSKNESWQPRNYQRQDYGDAGKGSGYSYRSGSNSQSG